MSFVEIVARKSVFFLRVQMALR